MSIDAQGNFAGKRLVVFGAGYVGGAIVREGLARGMHVTALTRNPAKAAALRDRGAEVVVADLADTGWHEKIPGRVDFVLNSVSSGGGGLIGYERSYLKGMQSIVAWATKQAVAKTWVYTSSTSVYPQGEGAVVTEDSATGDAAERPRVLLASESALRAGLAAAPPGSDARWFILRLAGIYGPGRHHLLDQVRAGEVAGRGDYRLNLIHLADISAAIWAAFGAPGEVRNQICNLADDEPATKAEITAWLAVQLGRPPLCFSGEPAVGRRTVTPDRVISNAKAKRLFGWAPRYPSFREGYAAILRA